MEFLELQSVRKLSIWDINKKIKEAKKHLFDLRIKNKLQSLKEKHLISKSRKYIAKLKTVSNDKIFSARLDSIMNEIEK